MRPQELKSRKDDAADAMRLETPRTMGIRNGMSSSGVIGRKLGFVYGVDKDVPCEMHDAIQQLHRKLSIDG